MTRRDLSGRIGLICLCIIVGAFAVFQLYRVSTQLHSILLSEVEAQESAEFSDDIELIHPIYRGTTLGSPQRFFHTPFSEGFWQEIKDTVKAVLARELRQRDLGGYKYDPNLSDSVQYLLNPEWDDIADDIIGYKQPEADTASSIGFSQDKFPSVRFTNGIPICPYCRVPTKREGGISSVTAMYYQSIYNENGKNINSDRNIHTTEWECLKCGKHYTVEGNSIDGWRYSK